MIGLTEDQISQLIADHVKAALDESPELGMRAVRPAIAHAIAENNKKIERDLEDLIKKASGR